MQYGLRCGKLEGRHFEVVEYQSILVKVTMCKEGTTGCLVITLEI